MLWRGALNHRIQAMTSRLPTVLLNIAGESLLGFGCRGQLALASRAQTRALGGESEEPAELPQPEPGKLKVAESTSGLSSYSGTECAISLALLNGAVRQATNDASAHKDDGPGAMEWTGRPEQDQVLEMASLYDIGQCQHAEEVIFEPADIIAAAADGIITTTSTGVVTGWNPAAERLCGYSANEVKGQPLFSLVPPHGSIRLPDLLERVQQGGHVEQQDLILLRKDGRCLNVSASLSPINNATRNTAGAVWVVREKTERRAAERMQDEFVAMVTHELRTPMNGILGMTNLLLRTNLMPRQRQYIEAVGRSGEALLTVVNDILTLSRLESGHLDLEVVAFDVREVLEDVIFLLAETAHQKGLELACGVDPNVPGGLLGDPGRLRQILLNLIGNAIKFTDRGEVIVRAQLAGATPPEEASAPHDGVVVCFEVMDTGIGISPDVRQRLFQPFSQADRATERIYGGSGLGLAICKRLVRRMGGHVDVASEPGAGSTFWFTVPYTRAVGSPTAATPRTSVEGQRILVVDDHAATRGILEGQLASWGMIVSSAADGVAALECLHTAAAVGTPYALALVDLQMPKMDGLELARVVQADPILSATRLVLLAPVDQAERDVEGYGGGLPAILTKPVRRAQLVETLEMLTCGAPAIPSQVEMLTGLLPSADVTELSDAPRILVVDDSPVNQSVAVETVRHLGYQADAVSDGWAALKALSRMPYAAVLLDCHMPGLDGFATSTMIRRSERAGQHIPIIALTGSATTVDAGRCLVAGMDHYLTKPLCINDLDATLRRLIADALVMIHRTEPATLDEASTTVERVPIDVIDETALAYLRRLQRPDHSDIVAECVATFTRTAARRLAALRTALEKENPQALEQEAHALKGEASTLGAAQMETLCAALMRFVSEGRLAQIEELLNALDSAFLRARAALEPAEPA
jgi:two-component system, sensor histidine kinase and response regulator